MKKKLIFIALILALTFVFIACDKTEEPVAPPVDEPVIDVGALRESVTINADNLSSFDFKSLFYIVEDGKPVTVEDSFIDKSNLPAGFGSGSVSCAYKGKRSEITVTVYTTVYELNLKRTSVSLYDTEVEAYDFSALFEAYIDGEKQPITEEMTASDVKAETGVYSYTVTFRGITKKLIVIVDNGVTVSANVAQKTIDDKDIETYDFKKLFNIKYRDKWVEVKDEFIDRSHVGFDGGYVVCNYMGKSAQVEIISNPLDYRIVKMREAITLHTSVAEDYDYAGLFTFYLNGKQAEITPDNIISDVRPIAGSYTVRAVFGRASATVAVTVSSEHIIEIVPAYGVLQIFEEEIESYDFSESFWLYIDGKNVDTERLVFYREELIGCVAGQEGILTVECGEESTLARKQFSVRIVAPSEPIVTVKNVVTYPNGGKIDLTTLFSVTVDGKAVTITQDMISGTVDYLNEGVNVITLTYGGEEYHATVELKRGVVINPVEETVTVLKGTDKSRYDFSGDFVVYVNGIRFYALERYIDVSGVDFNAKGEYEGTITVSYGASKSTTVEAVGKITYKVVDSICDVKVVEDNVILSGGATSFDVASNLLVYVNGRKQTLTDRADWADAATVYYEMTSAPIDFAAPSVYTVKITVFPDGADGTGVEVEYKVTVQADITITPTDKAIFSGTTVYPRDMFVVTENGEIVYPDFDCIEGKVNVFVPGVYYVNIKYKGISATSRIVVIDNAIKGVYHTPCTTIPKESEEDEEGYIIEGEAAKPLSDMIVSENEITVNGSVAEIIGAVDERTVRLNIGRNEYLLHYDDGIAVVDPDNAIKMSFNNYKRPIIYFNEDKWTIEKKVIVNRGSKHVLEVNYTTYSIDAFRIRSTETGTTKWYALYINLIEKYSSDTVYKVTWGEAVFPDGFVPAKGVRSTLTYDGQSYIFDMSTETVGKVDLTAVAPKKYAGKQFRGSVEGVTGTLRFDSYENITFTVGGTTTVVSGMAPSQIKGNGGINYDEDVVFIYDYNENTNACYSYKLSLNVTDGSFVLAEKDSVFGFYRFEDKFVFLDGYGTGHVRFDGNSGSGERITYVRFGGEIEARGIGEEGTDVSFYLGELLNILTVKTHKEETLVGARFINKKITDGAVVTMQKYTVPVGTIKSDLRELIIIETKDGLLSSEQKKSCVDVTAVNINEGRFYQFTVKLQVEGKEVTAYYATEYQAKIYKGNSLAVDFGKGLVNSTTALAFDECGNATLVYGGITYTGEVFIDGNSFTAKVRSVDGIFTSVVGRAIADGIVTASGRGGAVFNESFVTNGAEVATSGSAECVLRKITVNGAVKYFLSTTAATLGEEASLETIEGDGDKVGSIIKITASKIYYAKIASWTSATNGLVPADSLKGSYTNEDGNTLVLDGFGKATYGDREGTYVLNARGSITFVNDDFCAVFVPDKYSGTYRNYDVTFDEKLVRGKAFEATYMFVCGEAVYSATTRLTFGANNIVVVKSESSDHDGDCGSDVYAPSFGDSDGVFGRYTVEQNRVIVQSGEETFVFVIDDVTLIDKITCVSTTVASDAQGYFGAGTAFASR
ncbi:MAG: hypothetical protein ACI4SK_00160 [Christensenellales bacterium]